MSIRLLPWMVAVSATIAVVMILGAGLLSGSYLTAGAVAGSVSCGFLAGLLIGVEAAAVGFKPQADSARDEIALRGEELTAANTRIEALETELARTQQQWEQAADLAESHLTRLHTAEARLVEAGQ